MPGVITTSWAGRRRVLALALCLQAPILQLAAAEISTFDFETGLDGWRVAEGAFGALRCSRAEYHHHGGPYRKQGEWFLSTLESPQGHPDDAYIGVVESPVFRLSGPELRFMVGGGNHPNTYVALCTMDGREVRRAAGKRSQEMVDVVWDVADLVGEQLFLRIADGHTGGWGHVTADAFRFEGRIDLAASAAWTASRKPVLEPLRALTAPTPPPPLPLPPTGSADTLRAAIADLARRFGARYPDGPRFLAELEALETIADPEAASAAFAALQRRALVANPLVREHPILFVVRAQYKPDHHNTETMFQAGSINAAKYQGGSSLRTIDFAAGPAGVVRTLLEAGPEGLVRDPDVDFCGTRVVFSLRRDVHDSASIYTLTAEGGTPQRLTAAAGVTDIDPLFLPDGSIAFTSTREPKFCMCNAHIMGNLFRMDADGANVHQIGKSTLHEGHGSLMPDGRILYSRWEYVDRNFGDAQGLWTVNPDGVNHAVYWGNNTACPGGVLDPRIIPGTQQAVCVFAACHDRPWGALAIIDRRLAVDGRPGVLRTWPATAVELVDRGHFDTFLKVQPRYEDPFPLADTSAEAAEAARAGGLYFLCSRQTGNGEQMGLCLLDTFGNEIILHAEGPGCYDPMPLRPRPRPPIIPPRRAYGDAPGTLYVADVHQGTHMEGVERGSVRWLRVVESPEKRFWTGPAWGGQGIHRPAMNWHGFENKRILGTVPVHPDGSAAFQVPPDTFVYFQLLDAEGMMVQSMRSGTLVQSGETTGCIGCHEARQAAPPLAAGASTPAALTQPPAELQGWHGPPRLFSFLDEVQPVLDRHCAACHDFGRPGAAKVVLAGDRSETFNVAYNELWRKGLIRAIGAGPAAIQPARSWGSHASPLIALLRQGHLDVRLTDVEFSRLVTWIDINAPYYPTYASAYPDNLAGRCPIPPAPLARLGQLTGTDFARLASHQANQGPRISFDRPGLSPCLNGVPDDRPDLREEALAIIRAGAAALAERPRGDSASTPMAMCETDQRREAFYAERLAVEKTVRLAIQSGGRVYDPSAPDGDPPAPDAGP